MQTLKQYAPRVIASALLVLLGITIGAFLASPIRPNGVNSPDKIAPPLPTKITTAITALPRTSDTDSNVEVTQVYRAKVNGEAVQVPIKTTSPFGTKGVITQEFDISPILNRMVQTEVKAQEKRWDIGVGVGVNRGNLYVPISVQKDKWSAQVNLDHQGLAGGQIMRHWKF